MNSSRTLNVTRSFSLAALAVLFSVSLLQIAGCPQNNDADNTNDNTSIVNENSSGHDQPAANENASSNENGSVTPVDNSNDNTSVVVIRGDLDGDGTVTAEDIRPFVLALIDLDAFYAEYPDGNPTMADVNGDGRVDAFDIDPFQALLFGE